MADRARDKQFYEITKEKPSGRYQILMVGGSAGSVLAFLVISLVGAYTGMALDSLVLSFLAASFLGFFLGGLLTWLSFSYFGKISKEFEKESDEKTMVEPEPIVEENIQTELSPDTDENKGQSVDFVFPELSPDKK
jgi:hypothetical protein